MKNPLWRRLCGQFPSLAKLDRRVSALRDIDRLRRSGAFHAEWYAASHPDISRTGLSPLVHYVRKGAWEGRRPRPDFDPLYYLSIHPDVAQSGVEPFTHYVLFGKTEGRAVAPGRTALSDLAERRRARHETPGDARAAGWYGSAILNAEQMFAADRATSGPFAFDALPRPLLADADADGGRDWCMRLGPVDLLQEHIATRQPPAHVAPSPITPAFTIITLFAGDRAGFARTAGWITALRVEEARRDAGQRVDWIVVNDDPGCGVEELQALLPADLRALTALRCDGRRMGAAARRNQAVLEARGDFVLFVDAGEILAPDALGVLTHYIAAFPLCRCICAGFVEFEANDRARARQDRPLDAAELPMQATAAGLLAAVRTDLVAEIGGFEERFEQAETYAFTLRAAMREPLLVVPQPLIGRRVDEMADVTRAEQRMRAARVAALREIIEELWPQAPRPARASARVERGLCLVRTQGQRPELLAEALRSIYEQTEPLVAAVIVHGDADTFARVRDGAPKKEGAVVFLHAADTSRRRGHPWNVGLDYLDQHRDAFQYLCFLDDDDIYYPLFTSRMVEAFDLTGADVVYALVNRRTPGGVSEPSHMPLPTSCLVAGNFIPTNSYAVRTEVLAGSGIRALEDVDYFEDWDFLVSLLDAGCRFHMVPEAVGEFLLIGDGNAPSKRDPTHHTWCLNRVLARGEGVAAHLGMGRFYRDLMDFDFRDTAVRHPSPGGHLILAKQQFLRAGTAAG